MPRISRSYFIHYFVQLIIHNEDLPEAVLHRQVRTLSHVMLQAKIRCWPARSPSLVDLEIQAGLYGTDHIFQV